MGGRGESHIRGSGRIPPPGVACRAVDPFSHEQPILLVLPPGDRVEVVLPQVLADPEIHHVAYPAVWVLDKAGIDLPAAAPGLRTINIETLEQAVGALLRLCDEARLDGLVDRTWREVDERVRQHYLDLGIARSFAQIFKLAPGSANVPPPAAFRRDRIHENGFDIQYRLAREDGDRDLRAPPEEGSIVLYPFDPPNAEARTEAGLEPEGGAVLEIFAYESGRDRHLAYWEGVAARGGWRTVDSRQV